MAYEPPPRDGHTAAGSPPSAETTSRSRWRSLTDAVLSILDDGRLLWSIVILAMVLDIVLTGIGLSIGLRERNPVALALIESYGLIAAGLVLKGGAVVIGYLCWRFYPGSHRGVVPLGLALPSWAAVGINLVTIYSVL